MRNKVGWWVVAAMTAAMSGVGYASSIPAGTYDVSGLSVDGFQLQGTVTLDASGIVDAAQIELEDGALGNPVFSQISSAGGPAGYAPTANYAYITDPGVGQISLQYLTAQDGSGDVGVCTASAHDCNSYQASYMQIYESSNFGYGLDDLSGTGELEAAVQSSPGTGGSGGVTSANSATTPEPASLALLGTGILCVASMTRKRKRR
ncbi:MAG TPA: PEP-CTERM sorting domain-containing protein [Candidatus Aquilonibacter sp.]|nr:PEP-CTERM sorting domain-containing protein [Candidatus Aquilonibacter sp.]